MDGTRAEPYQPILETKVGVALARVRSPEDAVAFVGRYGLLRAPLGLTAGEPPPKELTAPYVEFESAADDLKRILRTLVDMQHAAAGDRAAMTRLRQDFGPRDPDEIITVQMKDGARKLRAADWVHDPDDFAPMDDRTVLGRAGDWAALALNTGLLEANAWPYVFSPVQLFPDDVDAPSDRLRIGILPETLLGYCYLTVAEAAAREPINACDECQRPFVREDRRQRFCEPACASRARFRRFKGRQEKERG